MLVPSKDTESHCTHLQEALKVARDGNLHFNKKKLQLAVPRLKYLGHIISSRGVEVDPQKVEAISSFPSPSNKQELLRFLGMATYLLKFVPHLSEETRQLRDLLRITSTWHWDASTEQQFNRVKQLLSNTPVLVYFDSNKHVQLSVDASSYGLGGVLLQEGKPVAYTSATLNDTQQRYAQIEELLAIVYACEHFHYYVYGHAFEVQTDHKPLLGLMKKLYGQISPRLQRQVQRYHYSVTKCS